MIGLRRKGSLGGLRAWTREGGRCLQVSMVLPFDPTGPHKQRELYHTVRTCACVVKNLFDFPRWPVQQEIAVRRHPTICHYPLSNVLARATLRCLPVHRLPRYTTDHLLRMLERTHAGLASPVMMTMPVSHDRISYWRRSGSTILLLTEVAVQVACSMSISGATPATQVSKPNE